MKTANEGRWFDVGLAAIPNHRATHGIKSQRTTARHLNGQRQFIRLPRELPAPTIATAALSDSQELNAMRKLLSSAGIQIADSAEDLGRIGQLRYSVYVDELGMNLSSSDHRTKQIRDVHDASALHLFVTVDGLVVGCVRMHIRSIPEPLAAPLEMRRFDSQLIVDRAFISKLIIHARARRSSVFSRLLRGVYMVGHATRVQAMFCTTFPHLVPIYERLGMRAYRGMYTDPDFGPHYALVGWMRGERNKLFPSIETGAPS